MVRTESGRRQCYNVAASPVSVRLLGHGRGGAIVVSVVGTLAPHLGPATLAVGILSVISTAISSISIFHYVI